MHKKYLIGLLVAVCIGGGIVLWKYNGSVTKISTPSLHVVTSFYPLYFFASEIAGDKAEVKNITPAGAEPHDYEPTARDSADMEGSRLIILNGGGFESWANKIKENINTKQIDIVTAGEGLMTRDVIQNGESTIDPHVWLAPSMAQQMVDKIEAGFARVDPTNALYYASNADALKLKLRTLDTEYQEGLAHCAQKNIVTTHSAFGYLARAYHLNQVALAGLSPDAEPSSRDVARVAQFVKDHDIKYIFFESLVSPKLSQTVAMEVGARTLVLNPLEGLTSEEIAAGKNYLTEMRQNLINLKIALVCTS